MREDYLVLKKQVKNATDLDFDSYADIINYNFDLADTTIPMEFARQWFVVICTILLSILFVYSLLRLRRTQNGCDIDQIILIAELIKVSILSQQQHQRMDLTHLFRHVLLGQPFRLLHLPPASLRRHHPLQRHAVIHSHRHLLSLPLSVLIAAPSEDEAGERRVFLLPFRAARLRPLHRHRYLHVQW